MNVINFQYFHASKDAVLWFAQVYQGTFEIYRSYFICTEMFEDGMRMHSPVEHNIYREDKVKATTTQKLCNLKAMRGDVKNYTRFIDDVRLAGVYFNRCLSAASRRDIDRTV